MCVFWSLLSIVLNYMSIFMLVQYCFDYCSFMYFFLLLILFVLFYFVEVKFIYNVPLFSGV